LLLPSAPPAPEAPLPPAPLLDSARPGAAAKRGASGRRRTPCGRLHLCNVLSCSGAPRSAQLAAPLLLAARLRGEQHVYMQVRDGVTFGHAADVCARRQRLHERVLITGCGRVCASLALRGVPACGRAWALGRLHTPAAPAVRAAAARAFPAWATASRAIYNMVHGTLI